MSRLTTVQRRELDDQHAWRIVREALPRWWNTYTREHPNSTRPESQLRELAAHFAVKEALAARIDRPSGEHAELVARLRRADAALSALPSDAYAETPPGSDAASVIASQDERIASLERERDEARGWASGWQRIAETTCTVLGLDLIDPDKIVEAVRGKFEAAEARADALSVQVERKDAALKASRDPIVGLIAAEYNVETWGLTQRLALIDAALTDPAEKTEVAPPEQTQAVEDRT